MKHKMGNSPKCNECKFYREKEPNDGCREDGWCYNPIQNTYGINGRKRDKPTERQPVKWMWECRQWIDAEVDINHFEVVTGTPDPNRSEADQEYVKMILRKERENHG